MPSDRAISEKWLIGGYVACECRVRSVVRSVVLLLFGRVDLARVVEAVITVGMDVASSHFTLANHIRRNLFQIIRQSNRCHRVYKHRGEVVSEAKFRRSL